MKWWELVLIGILCALAAAAGTEYAPSDRAGRGYLPPPTGGASGAPATPGTATPVEPDPPGPGCELPFTLPCELG